MKRSFVLFAVFVLFLALSCSKDDDGGNTCNTDNITYTNTVKAIIENEGCANTNCHGPQEPGNFSLATYEDVKDFVFLDRMVGALRWEAGFSQMPKDSMTNTGREMLPTCDIDKIEAWIAAGTPE